MESRTAPAARWLHAWPPAAAAGVAPARTAAQDRDPPSVWTGTGALRGLPSGGAGAFLGREGLGAGRAATEASRSQ